MSTSAPFAIVAPVILLHLIALVSKRLSDSFLEPVAVPALHLVAERSRRRFEGVVHEPLGLARSVVSRPCSVVGATTVDKPTKNKKLQTANDEGLRPFRERNVSPSSSGSFSGKSLSLH